MTVTILSRTLGTNPASTRCLAHAGQIKAKDQCCTVKVRVDGTNYNVPICRVCDESTDAELIQYMITEARRHNATGAETSDFSRAMAKQEEV